MLHAEPILTAEKDPTLFEILMTIAFVIAAIAFIWTVAPELIVLFVAFGLFLLGYTALVGLFQIPGGFNHRPRLHDGADLGAFPTRQAAEEYLNGAWLGEVYGPMAEASDEEVKVAAANLKRAEDDNAPWN